MGYLLFYLLFIYSDEIIIAIFYFICKQNIFSYVFTVMYIKLLNKFESVYINLLQYFELYIFILYIEKTSTWFKYYLIYFARYIPIISLIRKIRYESKETLFPNFFTSTPL